MARDTQFMIDLLRENLWSNKNPAKERIYQTIMDPQYNLKNAPQVKLFPWNQYGFKKDGKTYKWKGNACGSEVSRFLRDDMGVQPTHTEYGYLERGNKRDRIGNIKYNPVRLKAGVEKIKLHLMSGKPVRAPIAYQANFTLRGTSVSPHHYIGIVGFSGDRFLYIDPAPGLSGMRYGGRQNDFMGILEYNRIRNELSQLGHHFYVVAGPLK